jgi:hypothetical protein
LSFYSAMVSDSAVLRAELRDTSSRALFDINMRCPSGCYAVVPKSLAKKSEILGEMVEAVGDDDSAPPVAPGGLLNEWIRCSSRLQAQELDGETTQTLTSYLRVRAWCLVSPGLFLNSGSATFAVASRSLDDLTDTRIDSAACMQVADFFADKAAMQHLARLLGLRLNKALARRPGADGSSRVMTAAACYEVRHTTPIPSYLSQTIYMPASCSGMCMVES